MPREVRVTPEEREALEAAGKRSATPLVSVGDAVVVHTDRERPRSQNAGALTERPRSNAAEMTGGGMYARWKVTRSHLAATAGAEKELARRRNVLRNVSHEALLVRLRKVIVVADRRVMAMKSAAAHARTHGLSTPRGEQPRILLGEYARHHEDIDEIAVIAGALCPFIADRPVTVQRDIASLGQLELTQRGRVLINQGMEGSRFFMLLSGEVDVLVDNRRVATLRSGATFGETSLRSGVVTSATCVAASQCYLFTLSKKAFLHFFSTEHLIKNKETAAFFLEHVRSFRLLSERRLLKVAAASVLEKFKSGHCFDIDYGSRLYIIESGTVEILKRKEDLGRVLLEDENADTWQTVCKLHKGDAFGQAAFFPEHQRGWAAATVSKCTIFCVSKNALLKCASDACIMQLKNDSNFRDEFHAGRMGLDLPGRRLQNIEALRHAMEGNMGDDNEGVKTPRRGGRPSAPSLSSSTRNRAASPPPPPPRIPPERRKHMIKLKSEILARLDAIGWTGDDDDVDMRGIGKGPARKEVVKRGSKGTTQGNLMASLKILARGKQTPSRLPLAIDESGEAAAASWKHGGVPARQQVTTTDLIGSALMGWMTSRGAASTGWGRATKDSPAKQTQSNLKAYFAKERIETSNDENIEHMKQESIKDKDSVFAHMARIAFGSGGAVIDTMRGDVKIKNRKKDELMSLLQEAQEEMLGLPDTDTVLDPNNRPASNTPLKNGRTAIQDSLSWADED